MNTLKLSTLPLAVMIWLYFSPKNTTNIVLKEKNENQEHINSSLSFNNYWFDGKAELSSYNLKQARYGEIHDGEATIIFVTEPFSKSKQVKLDNGNQQRDKVDVLKMNFMRKFNTGLYPYSTMLSAFNHTRNNQLVKVTNSTQEWCGHVFIQLNKEGKKLNYLGRSYFESEGDVDEELEAVLTEDELWNRIRLNPKKLFPEQLTYALIITT